MNEARPRSPELSFAKAHEHLGIDLSSHYTSGVATADFNNDGFSDLLVMTEKWVDQNTNISTDGKPILFVNNGNRNRAISIDLEGTKSNRNGVGARVELVTASTRQTKEVYAGSSFLSTDSKRLTFKKRHILKLEINWPSGCREEYLGLDYQKNLKLVEGEAMDKWRRYPSRKNYAFCISENCQS